MQPAGKIAVWHEPEVGGLNRDHNRVVVVEVCGVEILGTGTGRHPELIGKLGKAAAERVTLLVVDVVQRVQRAHARRRAARVL